METSLDPEHLELLSQLCVVLQNPTMPTLLQRLGESGLDQSVKELPVPPPLAKPTLIQRMGGLRFSNDSKKQPIPSGGEKSLKRMRSPPSLGSSGRTLMS